MAMLPMSWALKARALLLDSPFAGVDPAGERDRREAIETWFEAHGVRPVDPAQQALLGGAARDAYDAMSLLRRSDSQPPVVGEIVPVHPLSAERLEPAFPQATAASRWQGFWERFSRADVPAVRDAASYRRLFQAWAEAAFEQRGAAAKRVSELALLPTDALRPDCPVWSHRRLAAAIAGARAFSAHELEGGRPALLYLHVGPVQSFISAARRTHDLWMGSFLLSFLVLQAARAVADELGPDAIVYPDLTMLPLARRVVLREEIPQDTGDQRGDPRASMLRASIANRVLAVVPAGAAELVAGAAMKAVDATWAEMARRARDPLQKALGGKDPRDFWQGFEAQIGAHLEMDAIALPWPETREAARTLFEETFPSPDPLRSWPPEHAERSGFAYGPLFNLTHRILAAHRSTFDIPAPASAASAADDIRPKCTQCGLREQMGPSTPGDPRGQHRTSSDFWMRAAKEAKDAALQINVGEGLCAICLTKRFAPQAYFGAGDEEGGAKLGLRWSSGRVAHRDRALLRFPSTATIASAPFRKRAQTMAAEAAKTWASAVNGLLGEDVLDFTPPGNLLPDLGDIGRDDPVLAHDGSWLYESSYEPTVAWSDHRREPGGDGVPGYRALRERLPAALTAYKAMRRAAGEGPSAYYAVLQLDGDHMGEWLTGRHPRTPTIREVVAASGAAASHEPDMRRPLFPALHGELSRRLAVLAERLHEIVNEHLGRVVYSGGDDLLAFVPVAKLLPCLRQIRGAFLSEEHLGQRVSISAGIAVAHWRDPLGATLRAAREAEADAKRPDRAEPRDRWGRNRFSVRLLKRSGEEMRITAPSWTLPIDGAHTAEEPIDTVACLETLVWLLSKDAQDETAPDGAGEERDDRESLLEPAAAYKLQQELHMVGPLRDHDDPSFSCGPCRGREPWAPEDEPLAAAFWHRIKVHLDLADQEKRAKDKGKERVHAFLDAYWSELRIRYCLPRAARAFCDLLLMARFFVREGGAA